MSVQVPVTVLRVFCGEGGSGGNRLGVILDGPAVAEDDRQQLARILGYSETVFVDDADSGRIRIFTPEIELPFAGHPVVGTGWLLREQGRGTAALLTPAGKVELSQAEDGRTLASGRPEWCPEFELIEHEGPAAVEALAPGGEGWRYEWAWIDQEAGLVRARCFVPEAGIAEDEATGSAAMRLCAAVERPIEVHQGRGSVISAVPAGEGWIEIGGVVVID